MTNTTRSPVDTSRVTLGEQWEVQWWCDRFGCTEVALRRAHDTAGPSAAAIEQPVKEAAKEAFQNTGED